MAPLIIYRKVLRPCSSWLSSNKSEYKWSLYVFHSVKSKTLKNKKVFTASN